MSYDLDINHYNIDELKQFLHITPDTQIDIQTLNVKIDDLRRKIDANTEYDHQFKTKFNVFLNNANRILINSLQAEDTTLDYAGEHPVIHIPKTPFVYSNPSECFQGVINPFERRIITKVLSIDSEFRSNPFTNPNKFVCQLQNPFYNVISMNLVALELPRMWHSVCSQLSNNSFKINLYNMITYPDISITITLPNGNYSNAEMIDVLTNYFLNSTNGLQYLSFNINTVNGLASFYVDPNQSLPGNDFYYELDFSESGLGQYLGFQKPIYKVDTTFVLNDVFFSNPAINYTCFITGESSCGIVDNYIFVVVNDFNNSQEANTIISQTNEGYIGNNVLGRITLNVLPDNLLINNSSDKIFKKREYFGPVRIKQLEIMLINKNNKLISLLNNNFSIALEFQMLYSP